MDPRLIVIIAGLFVALAGYVCLAPDQFGFLRLPDGFAQLGLERIVTGLAFMLLGFIGVLSEIQGEPKRRRARPFGFGEGLVMAGPEPGPEPPPLTLEPAPDAAPPVPESDTAARSPQAGDAVEARPEP